MAKTMKEEADQAAKEGEIKQSTMTSEGPVQVYSLENQFLVASPSLRDPSFSRAVIYLCEHSEQGALGFVINHPTTMTLQDVFIDMSISADQPKVQHQCVFAGGPVQCEQGFVIHRTPKLWDASVQVSEGITVTSSRDILKNMAGQETLLPDHMFLLGYAGWTPGQLEQELRENAWVLAPADADIIFDTPIHERWSQVLNRLGVDEVHFSADMGHA